MRPQTAQRIVQNAINCYLYKDSNKLLYSDKNCRAMAKLYKKFVIAEQGEGEAYPYDYDDPESIRNNMMYISDRWRCVGRLKWIMYGVEFKRL